MNQIFSSNIMGNGTVRGLFIFNGDGGLSDSEIALGTPDASEAQSLTHHVDRCALRYRMFTKRLAVQGQDLNLIKNMQLGVIAFLLLTNKQFQDALSFIASTVKNFL